MLPEDMQSAHMQCCSDEESRYTHKQTMPKHSQASRAFAKSGVAAGILWIPARSPEMT